MKMMEHKPYLTLSTSRRDSQNSRVLCHTSGVLQVCMSCFAGKCTSRSPKVARGGVSDSGEATQMDAFLIACCEKNKLIKVAFSDFTLCLLFLFFSLESLILGLMISKLCITRLSIGITAVEVIAFSTMQTGSSLQHEQEDY